MLHTPKRTMLHAPESFIFLAYTRIFTTRHALFVIIQRPSGPSAGHTPYDGEDRGGSAPNPGGFYLFCSCWDSCSLCSWNRSETRCWEAIHLRTQRLMHPLSREERALEEKSSTQETKQCSTRPLKACKLTPVSPESSIFRLKLLD
jgi:hypothetical protein